MRPSKPRPRNRQYGRLIVLIISVLAVVVLVTQVGSFGQAIPVLRHAKLSWVFAGLAAAVVSYCLAAATYQFLAVKRLRYGQTLLIQLGSMFTNRLLPAGIGALGINFAYLRKRGHTAPAASSVVALNNLLGLIGHASILLLIILIEGAPKTAVHSSSHNQPLIILIVVAVLIAAGIAVGQKRRQQMTRFARQTAGYIAAYRRRPLSLVLALISSALVTSCYAVVLYTAARASGIQLTPVETFIILSLGVAGGAVVPTPGGVGGAEASLVGGLVLYGVKPAPALAAALLYRVLTYWLPFVFGIAGFVTARRQKLI